MKQGAWSGNYLAYYSSALQHNATWKFFGTIVSLFKARMLMLTELVSPVSKFNSVVKRGFARNEENATQLVCILQGGDPAELAGDVIRDPSSAVFTR